MNNSEIITITGLSKKYRIGIQEKHDNLREAIASFFSNPIKRINRFRGASDYSKEETIYALKEINLTVKQGEVLGIIGRNGAGKSTLLKILSRITEPTDGEIIIRGRLSSLLEVGTGFHPELTGRENIYLNAAILGMTKNEINEKFDEIVRFSEIRKFLDTPVKRYSSGMYVRLAFSVAAHLEPEILLVDEVLAVGDIGFQKKCLGKMHDVSSGGKTIIFVSHNMAAIENLCTRCIVINDGEITFNGNTDGAIKYYHSQLSETVKPTDLLSEDISRIGDSRIRFKNIAMLNSEEKTSNQIYMGEDVTIKIGLKVNKGIKEPRIAVFFKNQLGQTVFRTFTWEKEKDFSSITNDCEILCKIPNLPLLQGRYYLNIWIGEYNKPSDFIESVLSFDVLGKDVFGTGRQPDQRYGGVVFVEHEWDFL
ncbi:MAG: ABC transporter ATP-binding protein [Candidatus Marinimicrobia bacterium]|nr:ABC transporter ATP-binding protein [bacterium]MCG2716265.1 ABC transporter ATP-binding protein [Candidatus Neomarinimicrobiota bacterium]